MSRRKQAEVVLENEESLLDLVDHLLTKGVVITGELVLGVADVDLIYLRLSLLLCAADRVIVPRARATKKIARPKLAPPMAARIGARRR